MKVAVLYSGGKDSNFALFNASKFHEISCLISINSQNDNSYMFQKPGQELIELHSKALEIPLVQIETKGEKEKELEDLKKAIFTAVKKYKIKGIVTGAIQSIYQSSRIQKICDELGLFCFNPLWQIDEKKYLDSLIKNNFEVIIIGIASYPFTKEILGKKIEEKLIVKLNDWKEKFGISLIGEGGEFETLALDGPLHKKKISIEKFDIIMDGENSGFMKNIVGGLVEK
jgi:ABC transporter with metal-binding/Fe-S-binding domain ATP-binding protein